MKKILQPTLVIAATLPAMLCGARGGLAVAQVPRASAFAIDEVDPERSVPSPQEALEHPLEMGYFVMGLSAKAEAAEAAGNPAQAARFYRALARAIPDSAKPLAKACRAHHAAGQWQAALDTCRGAMGREGVTSADMLVFLQVMLDKEGALDAEEVDEMDAVIAHLAQEVGVHEGMPATLANIECRLAARVQDANRLSTCAQAMRGVAPKAPETFVYASTAALARGDWDQARRVIERAREAGLPAETLDAMAQSLAERQHPDAHLESWPVRWWPGAAAGLALLALLAALARRRTHPDNP